MTQPLPPDTANDEPTMPKKTAKKVAKCKRGEKRRAWQVPEDKEEAGRRETRSSKAMKATISATLVVCALLLALAAEPPRALASENANWGTGVEMPPPANAAETRKSSCVRFRVLRREIAEQSVNTPKLGRTAGSAAERGPRACGGRSTRIARALNAISCPSAGDCTTVGGNRVLSETGGVWGSAAEVTPPANAASIGHLSYVSCSSAGNCTAAGGYKDSSGRYQGQLVTETGGTWGTGVEASLPTNANPDSEAYIEGLSCASAGYCLAVGEYYDGAVDEPETLLVTETNGTCGRRCAGEPARQRGTEIEHDPYERSVLRVGGELRRRWRVLRHLGQHAGLPTERDQRHMGDSR